MHFQRSSQRASPGAGACRQASYRTERTSLPEKEARGAVGVGCFPRDSKPQSHARGLHPAKRDFNVPPYQLVILSADTVCLTPYSKRQRCSAVFHLSLEGLLRASSRDAFTSIQLMRASSRPQPSRGCSVSVFLCPQSTIVQLKPKIFSLLA